MSQGKRQLLAGKRAHIEHILRTQDRPKGYVDLKITRVLPALRRAEAKIDEGTYGICDDCNQAIAKKRLKVAPGATRCVSCQKIFEDSYT